MSKRRDKIQGGGVFSHANQLPERDSEALTRQIHGQRPPEELAALDREHDARIRSQFGAFVITSTGLDLRGEPAQVDWQQVGNYLFQMHGTIQWLIGDWLVYGEQLQWGDIKKIADDHEYNYASLRQYAYVSRALSIRIDKLSWNHHLLVAAMEDEQQATSLQYALDNSLSVAAFRKWLKGESPALPARIMDKEQKNRFNQLFRVGMVSLASVDTVEMMLFDAWWQDFKQQVRMAKK